MITGLPYGWDDLIHVAERVWHLTRSFNARENPGFGRGWDYPPARFMEEPVPTGPAKGKFIPKENIDLMLDEYYSKRGWTPEGIPTKKKLEEMGLAFAADSLEKAGYDLG